MKWNIALVLLLTLGSQSSLGALWSYGRSAFGFPEAPMSFFSRGKLQYLMTEDLNDLVMFIFLQQLLALIKNKEMKVVP